MINKGRSRIAGNDVNKILAAYRRINKRHFEAIGSCLKGKHSAFGGNARVTAAGFAACNALAIENFNVHGRNADVVRKRNVLALLKGKCEAVK